MAFFGQMAQVTISREELFELVWKIPLVRLAVQFGVSNVALGKLCRRLNIPLPGRGYWARLAAGEKPKRPGLPKPTGNQAFVRLTMDPTAQPVPRPPRLEPPKVAISQDLGQAHDVVRRVAIMMKNARVDEHERIVVGGFLAVTVASHRRALLLLDAVCHELVRRGHQVFVQGSAEQATIHVTVGDESVAISLSESLDRVEHQLTPEERERMKKGDTRRIPKYDYAPGGRLKFSISGASLADSAKHRLERVLGHVVLSVEAVAEEQRRRRQEAARLKVEEEERKRREAEERAHARRQKLLEEYRHLLARDLEFMAVEWMRVNQMRQFLHAYEIAVPGEHRTAVAESWLSASKEYVDRLDPLLRPDEVPKPAELPDNEVEAAIAILRKTTQS